MSTDDSGETEHVDYRRGLDDYHDPTGGFAGYPPARSALTLRLWLAAFGLLMFAGATVYSVLADLTWPAIILGALTVLAAANLAWVAHRKRRGEPG